MKVTVDTNVLIRAVIRDDPKQAKKAPKILEEASRVVITLTSLCELVWSYHSPTKSSLLK
jgi:predicted nucleic acid-binding protein